MVPGSVYLALIPSILSFCFLCPMRCATLYQHTHPPQCSASPWPNIDEPSGCEQRPSKPSATIRFFSFTPSISVTVMKVLSVALRLNILYGIMHMLSMSCDFLWESGARGDCGAVTQGRAFACFSRISIPCCMFTFLARNIKVRGRVYKRRKGWTRLSHLLLMR